MNVMANQEVKHASCSPRKTWSKQKQDPEPAKMAYKGGFEMISLTAFETSSEILYRHLLVGERSVGLVIEPSQLLQHFCMGRAVLQHTLIRSFCFIVLWKPMVRDRAVGK